jgi:hypothetical protein
MLAFPPFFVDAPDELAQEPNEDSNGKKLHSIPPFQMGSGSGLLARGWRTLVAGHGSDDYGSDG